MKSPRVYCPVEVPGEEVRANAFRVLTDGDTCLLDFLWYDPITTTARVVSRVRVRKDFLEGIGQRCLDIMGTEDTLSVP